MPQLRAREFDALVVDMHRISPADDLVIEEVGRMRAGFICRAGHPLHQAGAPVRFAALRRYPLASTPLSTEVARNLIARYGPGANPQTAITLRCDDIHAGLDTVRASDAIFLGIVGAAQAAIGAGELAVTPAPDDAARTEAPAMAIFRRFVAEHLHD